MEALGWYQKTVVERSKECTVVVGRKKTRFIQRLRGFIVVLIFFFLHFGPKTMNHRSFTKKKTCASCSQSVLIHSSPLFLFEAGRTTGPSFRIFSSPAASSLLTVG